MLFFSNCERYKNPLIYSFNGVNSGFVIIDFFTLNEAAGVNISFKLFYFSSGIVYLLNIYLKFIK